MYSEESARAIFFNLKCEGSLFEHSVSEQKVISHKKSHSLYEKDKGPACNLIYTNTNNELWLRGSAAWKHTDLRAQTTYSLSFD